METCRLSNSKAEVLTMNHSTYKTVIFQSSTMLQRYFFNTKITHTKNESKNFCTSQMISFRAPWVCRAPLIQIGWMSIQVGSTFSPTPPHLFFVLSPLLGNLAVGILVLLLLLNLPLDREESLGNPTVVSLLDLFFHQKAP